MPVENWDEWWSGRLERDPRAGIFNWFQTLVFRHNGGFLDPVNSTALLANEMHTAGLRTVLYAGAGVSQEPRGLAMAGLDVTVLDISKVALRHADAVELGERDRKRLMRPEYRRNGGELRFVVGDLLDPTVCPGPFDVVFERRTVQALDDRIPAALSALGARLSDPGILISHCHDGWFAPDWGPAQHPSGLYHASEDWFRENGWTIWDPLPTSALLGRVAWLLRSGTPKAPRPTPE